MQDQKLVKKDYLGVPKYGGVCFGENKLPFNLTVHQHPGLNILSVPIIWLGAM